jgi:predicted transposase/invertase (TIGR01784 family)
MGEAVTILKELSADERARLIFEAREKARMDELARMYGARAEGLAEGMSKGKAEGKAEMAKILLSKGVSLELIAESSGLSLREIEALAEGTPPVTA